MSGGGVEKHGAGQLGERTETQAQAKTFPTCLNCALPSRTFCSISSRRCMVLRS